MTETKAPWGTAERPWQIPVSLLDSWVWYRDNPEMLTPEGFLARLDRTEPKGAPAIIGSAFHNGIERAMVETRSAEVQTTPFNAFYGNGDGHQVEFSTYGNNTGDVDIELASYSIVEQALSKVISTPEGHVELRGRLDGIRGNTILDLKTTKSFKAEKFQDAFQWRTYLMMGGEQYRLFEYHVFTLSYGKVAERRLAAGEVPHVTITDYHQLSCTRYDEMERDVIGVVAELCDYVKTIRWNPRERKAMRTF